jgi:hypothetical protein
MLLLYTGLSGAYSHHVLGGTQRARELMMTRRGNSQGAWRTLGLGAGALGAPAGIGYLHPSLGLTLAAVEVVVVLVVFAAALFGSEVVSDRAFRLLRWFANRPEPRAPASNDRRGHLGGS